MSAQRKKRVSINDVAKHANVAPSTVSYVLNDVPGQVRKEVRERVLESISKLAYVPNRTAKALRKGVKETIGLPPGTSTPDGVTFFREAMLTGIIMEAAAVKQDLIVLTQLADPDSPTSAGQLLDQRADSYIFIFYEQQVAAVEMAASLKIPHVVAMDKPSTPSPYILMDNEGGSRMALDHLYDLGHRRIAHLHGELGFDSELRLRAYLDYVKERSLPFEKHWLAGGSYLPDVAEEVGYQGAKTLFSQRPFPTAVFTANDVMAAGAYRWFHEAGIRVPEDISVVGYDDTRFSLQCIPHLTTIRQDFESLGRMAVRVLSNYDPEATEPTLFTHPVSLVKRDSTSTPKQEPK